MNFLKKNVKLIAGILIGATLATGLTVFATYSYFANDISYTKPGTQTEISVEQALNDLYEKSQKDDNGVILVTSSWKQGVSWNNYGISDLIVLNSDYIELSGSIATIKKDCKIKITGFMRNTDQPNYAPQYKLTYNNQEVLSFTNGANWEDTTRKEVEISAKENDTFYVSMYGGGGNPTYYITWVEIVE